MRPPQPQREKDLKAQGFSFIAGIDEVGRGAWAGPVVAACLLFNFDCQKKLPPVHDSKLLSQKKREEFATWLMINFSYGLGVVASQKIDELGILNATKLAMQRAVANLKIAPDYLLIDAVKLPALKIQQENIIKGDQKIWSIAAASIIAKVFRDRLMRFYHRAFPLYGFDQHKGYGTSYHQTMIDRHGPCRLHRQSYWSIARTKMDQLF